MKHIVTMSTGPEREDVEFEVESMAAGVELVKAEVAGLESAPMIRWSVGIAYFRASLNNRTFLVIDNAGDDVMSGSITPAK